MNTLKIEILVDNHAKPGLEVEHGFATYIKIDNQRILFDTGQDLVLFENARKLGVDLSNLDTVILSHGHYDHTGEVASILKSNPTCNLYLHPESMLPRFSIRDGITKSIAITPKNKQAILNHPINQLNWVSKPTKITETLGLTGTIKKTTTFENNSGPFFLDEKGTRPDPINDDQSIWIETPEGLVILTGCCHSGIINTIEHIQHQTGISKIRAIIGGFHLRSASKEKQDRTIEALNSYNIQELIPCHCTGDETTIYLQNKLNHQVIPGYAGLTLIYN